MEKATATALVSSEAPGTRDTSKVASQHEEKGRSHWLSVIFWLLEQRWPTLLSIPLALAGLVALVSGKGLVAFAVAFVAIPLVGLGIPVALLIRGSRKDAAQKVSWGRYVSFRDPAEAARWEGKKIPMEILYEAYLAEKLDFKEDVYEVMLRRNGLFRFAFTWGDVKFYLFQFLKQNLSHSRGADKEDIAPVYDRGNDFYGWFLGETMIYTSGIFRDVNESLEEGQRRKLETVCQYVQMSPGDRHLDIGCGWGTLLAHAAKEHGTHSTGITLAKEQAEWARATAEKAGVSDRVRIIVDDYRNLPNEQYDKITCLEMAEHVGIRNFQQFLLQVRSMLKDDGIFYLQIAGLRREWQYEDLVWGLFMGKYIFPGADASCPLGFVVSQAERAGFEVHRVENCGVHYAATIRKWYANWNSNEAAIVEKYGQRWFRMWKMFLGWSAIIGGQGSSTVFMITLAKNIPNDKETVSPEEAGSVAYSRTKRWIGNRPVATQQ